jgi:CDP-diacylglycerol pyrophosphatase
MAARRVASTMMLGLSGLVALGLVGAAATERRQALWGVVQLCVADTQTTGSAFPCLAVDLAQGVQRGYVVLRPPVGRPDTILSPTRESIGIEDPELLSAQAPNYFAAAWNARRLAPNAESRIAEPDAFALGVNSRFARAQDQLHIHIGCLRRAPRLRLRALAGKLAVGVWSRQDSLIPGHESWIFRTGENDIDRLRPFELVAQQVSKRPWGDIDEITLGVAPVKIGAATEFVLFAFPSLGLRPYLDVDAADFIDSRCGATDE